MVNQQPPPPPPGAGGVAIQVQPRAAAPVGHPYQFAEQMTTQINQQQGPPPAPTPDPIPTVDPKAIQEHYIGSPEPAVRPRSRSRGAEVRATTVPWRSGQPSPVSMPKPRGRPPKRETSEGSARPKAKARARSASLAPNPVETIVYPADEPSAAAAVDAVVAPPAKITGKFLAKDRKARTIKAKALGAQLENAPAATVRVPSSSRGRSRSAVSNTNRPDSVSTRRSASNVNVLATSSNQPPPPPGGGGSRARAGARSVSRSTRQSSIANVNQAGTIAASSARASNASVARSTSRNTNTNAARIRTVSINSNKSDMSVKRPRGRPVGSVGRKKREDSWLRNESERLDGIQL